MHAGVVSVWDVAAGAQLLEYEAHAKRIWSVDFCAADPSLLASGSDDCAVKVWSTKSPSSVAQVGGRRARVLLGGCWLGEGRGWVSRLAAMVL